MKPFFALAITFGFLPEIEEVFISGMQEKHIPHMHGTGYFKRVWRQTGKDDGEFKTVTFTHEIPEGSAGWHEYNAGPRPEMKKEFGEMNDGFISSGKLKIINPEVKWLEEDELPQSMQELELQLPS